MRSRLGWFVKGLHGCSAFRESIKKLESLEQALERIDGYEKVLMDAASNYSGMATL